MSLSWWYNDFNKASSGDDSLSNCSLVSFWCDAPFSRGCWFWLLCAEKSVYTRLAREQGDPSFEWPWHEAATHNADSPAEGRNIIARAFAAGTHKHTICVCIYAYICTNMYIHNKRICSIIYTWCLRVVQKKKNKTNKVCRRDNDENMRS